MANQFVLVQSASNLTQFIVPASTLISSSSNTTLSIHLDNEQIMNLYNSLPENVRQQSIFRPTSPNYRPISPMPRLFNFRSLGEASPNPIYETPEIMSGPALNEAETSLANRPQQLFMTLRGLIASDSEDEGELTTPPPRQRRRLEPHTVTVADTAPETTNTVDLSEEPESDEAVAELLRQEALRSSCMVKEGECPICTLDMTGIELKCPKCKYSLCRPCASEIVSTRRGRTPCCPICRVLWGRIVRGDHGFYRITVSRANNRR